MSMFRPLKPLAAVAVATGGLAFAQPAEAIPQQFTSQGEAISYQNGKATKVPNTLFFSKGQIRLEMASPVSADGQTAFSVVLAQDGGNSITLLNPQAKQAMKLDATSLQAVTDNPSLQKISSFKLSEFSKTFRSQSKKVGTEKVAGEPTTVFEQKGKDGHFRLWLSDRHEIPLRFTYFEGGKPAFSYEVKQLTLAVKLPASSFVVPQGYEVTDLAAMLEGLEAPHQ